MPNLYTSLLARHAGITTLAPKKQLRPISRKTEALPFDQWSGHIAQLHSEYLAGPAEAAPPTRTIGIIGAGLAGLSAAYELRKRGYNVSILEASERPGGRTWTIHGVVKKHAMDGGAELVGANHPLWLTYRDIFHLGLSDVLEYKDSPIIVGTTRLSKIAGERLVKQMGEAFDYISARAKTIVDPYLPWTDPQAAVLDQENVHDFVMRTKWPRLCKAAILQLVESDNGVVAKKQSLLGLLAMVRGGGMERYWLDTEVYRSKRGAQALAFAFESALRGMSLSIQYSSPVTAIDASGTGVQVTTQNGQTLPFDEIVLAVPPSAWSKISTWLPDTLASFVGAPPQMGENTKALLGFHTRFWKKQHYGPSSTMNDAVDQTWETTEAHKHPDFGMVGFSGAIHAASLSHLAPPAVQAKVVLSLDRVYKHTGTRLTGFRFMNWPTEPWALASYSFPDCGDILRWGPKFYDGYQGKLHFAGEHTCYAFTGYMEGALQSGYRLARKIVLRDGRTW